MTTLAIGAVAAILVAVAVTLFLGGTAPIWMTVVTAAVLGFGIGWGT